MVAKPSGAHQLVKREVYKTLWIVTVCLQKLPICPLLKRELDFCFAAKKGLWPLPTQRTFSSLMFNIALFSSSAVGAGETGYSCQKQGFLLFTCSCMVTLRACVTFIEGFVKNQGTATISREVRVVPHEPSFCSSLSQISHWSLSLGVKTCWQRGMEQLEITLPCPCEWSGGGCGKAGGTIHPLSETIWEWVKTANLLVGSNPTNLCWGSGSQQPVHLLVLFLILKCWSEQDC